jgi:hypothetical protein
MRALGVRVVVAMAALVVVAGAAIGVPRDDRAAPPDLVLSRITAPLAHGNSHDGQAILTAENMAPGDRRRGAVTITNRGHDGAFYLVADGPHDRPGRGGGELSDRLELTIADVSAGAPQVVADGQLRRLGHCHPLGMLVAGQSRTYSFTLAFRPGHDDNRYAGASVRVGYEWRQTAAARDGCPDRSDDAVEVPGAPLAPRLGDVRLAIARGPYRFDRRRGTTRVTIRCIASDTRRCSGRLTLERSAAGRSKAIALAVARFDVRAGRRGTIVLRLNAPGRRRMAATRSLAVRARAVVRDSSGGTRSFTHRGRLVDPAARTARPRGRRR